MGNIKKILFLTGIAGLFLVTINFTEAHQSGCHRWHSCPSDSGSYTCGDAGHPCQYPTYPASGGVIYPPSGYYKDCYTCSVKQVPSTLSTNVYDSFGIGSESSSVKTIQLGLIKDGSYKEAVASGYYGSLTETAVKNFQKKYGIVSYGTPSTTGYGYFGPKTRDNLMKFTDHHTKG